MNRLAALVIVLSGAVSTAYAADTRDALFDARLLYNEGQYEAAIAAAERARPMPGQADRADLIAARAYLERYRGSAAPDDLANARTRLTRLDPQQFGARERLEFIVGLGETVYFDGSYGAAANLFESVLDSAEAMAPTARERVLDWWASAVDRDVWPRPEIERQTAYQRIRSQMRDELEVRAGSAAAAYWLAAAARAQGDLQAAWDAAESGWVRAALTPDRGATLRADLDKLVLQAIAPERAKVLAQPAETLLADWEAFKARWSTGE